MVRQDWVESGLLAQVVSCEMIEAVGHENLPTYFQAISGFLKPGGQAVIQVSFSPRPLHPSALTQHRPSSASGSL